MADLNTIIKAIDFIEAHLQDPVGVGDMADAVSYSLYYFSRSFHQVAHHTPYDYLIRRRIAEAAKDLSNGKRSIIDIAFKYQFNSHETFIRAFHRVMHMTPTAWRKLHCEHFAPMPRLTAAHLRTLPALKDSVEIKTIDTLTLFGVSQIDTAPASPDALWSWLNQELGDSPDNGVYELSYFHNTVPAMRILGVPDTFPIPGSTRLITHTLARNTYACSSLDFHCQKRELLLDNLLYTWLPGHNYSPNQAFLLYHHNARVPESITESSICIPITD